MNEIVFGNRIPKDYFITFGIGESDITVHAGSYHLALKDAGIEMCNIITYSSILPKIANEIKKPFILEHGSVVETIMAISTTDKKERITAGIIYGWLYDKKTKEKYGGLVCEYNGILSEKETKQQLELSLNELWINGYSDQYDLSNINFCIKSFTPQKKYGTIIVALCFVNYIYPIIKNNISI